MSPMNGSGAGVPRPKRKGGAYLDFQEQYPILRVPQAVAGGLDVGHCGSDLPRGVPGRESGNKPVFPSDNIPTSHALDA